MRVPCNVGGADRTIRIALGVGLIPLALLGRVNATTQALALGAAAIALTTALSGFCPLNSLLGIDTCR